MNRRGATRLAARLEHRRSTAPPCDAGLSAGRAAVGASTLRRRSRRVLRRGGSMSDRAYISTRKGLFTVARGAGGAGAGGWSIDRVAFLADNASMFLRDTRDGAMYVALGHGHFGV